MTYVDSVECPVFPSVGLGISSIRNPLGLSSFPALSRMIHASLATVDTWKKG